MKKLLLIVAILASMVCCPLVAPAAVLVQPIQGSTALYSGVADGPETAVFTLTLSITAEENHIRISRTPSGISSRIQGLPAASIIVLSSTLSSTATIIDGEYSVLNGQTKAFTLTTTVQTTQAGTIFGYLRGITWRDLPEPLGDTSTVLMGSTWLQAPPATINIPQTTPEPGTAFLIASGLVLMAGRRQRL